MKRYFVWTLVILNSLIGFTHLIANVTGSIDDNFSFTETVSSVIVIVAFSILGAIIILRDEGNRVGWLMILLGFVLADPFATYLAFNAAALQTQPSFLLYFAIWTQGWFFFLSIYEFLKRDRSHKNVFNPANRQRKSMFGKSKL